MIVASFDLNVLMEEIDTVVAKHRQTLMDVASGKGFLTELPFEQALYQAYEEVFVLVNKFDLVPNEAYPSNPNASEYRWAGHIWRCVTEWNGLTKPKLARMISTTYVLNEMHNHMYMDGDVLKDHLKIVFDQCFTVPMNELSFFVSHYNEDMLSRDSSD